MVVRRKGKANMYNRMIIMMAHLMMLISLVYIKDDTKVSISVSKADALLLLCGPCSKKQSCRMAITLTC
jgi:uncharacterized membrane protein (UPF0127 family)